MQLAESFRMICRCRLELRKATNAEVETIQMIQRASTSGYWNLRAFKDSLGAETIGKFEAAALLYHHAPWRARPPSCWAEMR